MGFLYTFASRSQKGADNFIVFVMFFHRDCQYNCFLVVTTSERFLLDAFHRRIAANAI